MLCIIFRIQEERDRRHSQKQRDKDGKPPRYLPPPSTPIHSELACKSFSSIVAFCYYFSRSGFGVITS